MHLLRVRKMRVVGCIRSLGLDYASCRETLLTTYPAWYLPLAVQGKLGRKLAYRRWCRRQGWDKRRREIQELFQVKYWQISDQQKPALSKGLGLALETTHGVDYKQSVRSC